MKANPVRVEHLAKPNWLVQFSQRCFWQSCYVGSVCRKDTLTSRMKLSVKLSKFMASIKHCNNKTRSETTVGKTCEKSVQRLKSRQRSFFFCHTEALAGAGFACFWWWKIEKMKVNVEAKKKRNLPTDALNPSGWQAGSPSPSLSLSLCGLRLLWWYWKATFIMIIILCMIYEWTSFMAKSRAVFCEPYANVNFCTAP